MRARRVRRPLTSSPSLHSSPRKVIPALDVRQLPHMPKILMDSCATASHRQERRRRCREPGSVSLTKPTVTPQNGIRNRVQQNCGQDPKPNGSGTLSSGETWDAVVTRGSQDDIRTVESSHSLHNQSETYARGSRIRLASRVMDTLWERTICKYCEDLVHSKSRKLVKNDVITQEAGRERRQLEDPRDCCGRTLQAPSWRSWLYFRTSYCEEPV